MRLRMNTQKFGWGRYQDLFIRSIPNKSLFLVILGRIGDISLQINGNKIINRDLQYI